MNEREIKNGVGKFESLDADGGDVAALLSSLRRVEAPKNFEFRVKAGIADGLPHRGALIPFLKLAAPLSLVLVVGGFLIYYGTSPTTNTTSRVETPQAPQLADNSSATVAIGVLRDEVSGPQLIEVDEPGDALTAQRTTNSIRPANNTRSRPDRQGGSIDMPLGGGSRDSALYSAEPKLPPEFESAQPRYLNANTGAASADVPVRSLLGILGITAEFADGGWKVQSVLENSIATRSSVLAGDVLEAIDGQQLKRDSVVKGSAKTLTIRRDGKTINLDLKN